MEESADKEFQQEVHVSIENEIVEEENTSSSENKNEIAVLVEDIMSMLESPEPSFSVSCRINRIPDQLRRVNEEAYTPRLISIGPLHHSSKRLQTMEKFKLKYLKNFLSRITPHNLGELITTVKEMKEAISDCYGETIVASMHNNDLLKIILVDAIFILELFLRTTGEVSNEILTMEAGIDLSVLMVDLVLLENQIPFFVIKKLCTMTGDRDLIKLTLHFFRNLEIRITDAYEARNVEHFTDLFRTILLPTSTSLPTTVYYRFDKLRYSATQLEEAGLKFQASSNELPVDLKFRKDVNELEIPSVKLSNLTEALFQNVIAFEQTRCEGKEFFSGYIAMLSSLIKTPKDMDLLCHYAIVDNRFHDSNAATLVVKNLCSSIIRANGSYVSLAADLNDFYGRLWRTQLHIWKNALQRDYFCNPWRSAATIAAFILLVLTLIQTVCSVLQVI